MVRKWSENGSKNGDFRGSDPEKPHFLTLFGTPFLRGFYCLIYCINLMGLFGCYLFNLTSTIKEVFKKGSKMGDFRGSDH